MSFSGRQIAAARALAGIGVRELATSAGVTPRTITRIEAQEVVEVAPKLRHGHVSAETWGKIVDALLRAGVELTPSADRHGAGVRWLDPRP